MAFKIEISRERAKELYKHACNGWKYLELTEMDKKFIKWCMAFPDYSEEEIRKQVEELEKEMEEKRKQEGE